MQGVRARDLFLHRVLNSLAGDAGASWLVFGVKQARESSDDYENTLWGVQPGGGGEPRRLTSAVFTASSPVLHPDGDSIAFISARGDKKPQWQLSLFAPCVPTCRPRTRSSAETSTPPTSAPAPGPSSGQPAMRR